MSGPAAFIIKAPLASCIAACLIVASGYARGAAEIPFVVTARGAGSTCLIEIEGRTVTMEQLPAIARLETRSGQRAIISADAGGTSYRCIGGIVYTLENAGFTEVRTEVGQSPPST